MTRLARRARVGTLPLFLVVAGAACGESTEPEVEGPDPVVLEAPEAIGTTEVELSWSPSAEPDFAAYRVYMGTSAGVDASGTPAAELGSAATTTVTINDLLPFTAYHFAVFVVDTRDATAGSNEASATTWLHHSAFDDDLEDWSIGTAGAQLDDVSWVSWGGNPAGSAKLDGSDFGTSDGQANSWMFRDFTLPAGVTTLQFESSPHNRDGADSELRVRLVDAAQASQILLDWAVQGPGIEDELQFVEMTADLTPYAGQSVTIYFEQGDNDVGNGEQRYLDNIVVR